MTYLVPFVVLIAAVLGLVIGSFLNVVAYRVPAGISLLRESRCPQCDAAVRPWQNIPVISWLALRGKCASCSAPISARYPIVEGVTGAAFGLVSWWMLVTMGPTLSGSAADAWSLALAVLAFLYFAAVSIVLTLVDLDTHRLPNSIVLPSYVVAGVLLTAAALLGDDWAALLRGAIGMAAMYAFYFLLRLARPGGMGGGDVKLAGVVGLYLGWVGWGALAVGAFAAFLYGGVFGIALLLLRRAGRKSAIPFGPWMILGAWTGVFAGDAVGRWYVNLITGA
jgi:leader peptidase (prepilin peptidase)/N-methyltransferase